MTAQAALARESALSFEAKKTGFGQAQDGWSLTLRIQDIDVPDSVAKAKKGTRFMVVLVEIGDDEQPVSHQRGATLSHVEATPRPAPHREPVGDDKERRPFASLPYPQQAALRCNDPIFWAFLREMCPDKAGDVRNSEDAKQAIYKICDVRSRADIKPDTEAAEYWSVLCKWFDGWLLKERVA